MKKALVIILVLSVAVALLPRAASADAKFGFKGGIVNRLLSGQNKNFRGVASQRAGA